MSGPQKRTDAETWAALEAMAKESDDRDEAEADEAEMARIAALSDEELDRELAAAGIDPAEARARGEEIAEKVRARTAAQATAATTSPVANVPVLRPRRLSRGTLVLLAAALAATLLGLLSLCDAIGRGGR
jgi:hypothetical protein